jgi:hypothetical protein
MPRAARLVASLVLACSVLAPGTLAAQTEFAVPLAPGQLRIDITPWWLSWDHRYDPASPGVPVPISGDFAADTFGVAQLPFLTSLQNQIRQVSGLSGFTLDLGATTVAMAASVRTIPIGFELGLTHRLAIGVTVPIVHSRVDVGFQVDTTKPGNVGFNPALLTPARDSGFQSQMQTALAALEQQAASGPAALRAPAQALLSKLRPYLTASGAPLLPLAGTAAGAGIAGGLASAESTYAQLAAQYAADSVSMPALTASFLLPDSGSTLGRDGLEQFFSDSAFPVAADTFGTVVRTGIGDITAHLTYQFADGRGYRGQLLFTTRFPTGTAPAANEFFDLGTGTHQMGLDLALANDLLLGDRFLVHAVARVGGGMADQIPMRVTPPSLPFAPIAQLATIKRTPGSYVGLDLAPTWMMDDAFSVRVDYSYFSQGAMRHSYVNPSDAARVGLPASVLDEGTAMSWMRLGAGVTFSTVDRFTRGLTSLPYTLTVSYANTVWAAGGRVPKISEMSVMLRAYVKLFK